MQSRIGKKVLLTLASVVLMVTASSTSAADAQVAYHACPNPTWTAVRGLSFGPGYHVAYVDVPSGVFGLGGSYLLSGGQARYDTYSMTQTVAGGTKYYWLDYQRNQSGMISGWYIYNYC